MVDTVLALQALNDLALAFGLTSSTNSFQTQLGANNLRMQAITPRMADGVKPSMYMFGFHRPAVLGVIAGILRLLIPSCVCAVKSCLTRTGGPTPGPVGGTKGFVACL